MEQDFPSWPDDPRLSVHVSQGAMELEINSLDELEAGVWLCNE